MLAQVTGGAGYEADVEYHHAPTEALDENGQGNAHVSFACAAHRATVDADPDLGLVRNASFTDYVIPTPLDMPDVTIAAFVEEPEPGAPYGAKGIGEPPTISSSAAIAAAIRAATGQPLPRIPIRPADIALG